MNMRVVRYGVFCKEANVQLNANSFVSEGIHLITVRTFQTPQNKEKPVFHIENDVEHTIKMLLGISLFALKHYSYSECNFGY